MLKLFSFLKLKEWLAVGVSFTFIVAQIWLELRMPEYMAEITILVQTPGSAIGDIWIAGGFMLLCALGSLACAIIIGFIAARIAASFSQRVRSMLFNKVDSFSSEEINRFSTSSLITRSTNDITQVQMLITMSLQVVIRAPIMAVWAIIKIMGKGIEWSIATGVAVMVIIIMATLILIFVMPKFKIMQKQIDDITRETRENLTGLRVIRAYNAEKYQETKFETANIELTDTQLYTSRAMSVVWPIMVLLMSGLSLAIYWIGAQLINTAGMELIDGVPERLVIFSNMTVFLQYAMQVVMSFIMMIMVFFMFPRAIVSGRRIFEVLDTQPTIVGGEVAMGQAGLTGEVSFKHVSFKYPGAAEYVLEDINFAAKKGETVAFIGSTGSGKTTLVNLMLRLFDVSSGQILVSGVDVRDYKPEALYDKIGYVSQQTVMFKGTVSSNVAYGSFANASDADGSQSSTADEQRDNDVKWAVELAQGKDFVEEMEDDYQAEIAQGGTNISGGQKQRLAIARAIYRRPEIFVFDDSFSALDYKTDRNLRNALRTATADTTCFIVAQRIGTIMNANQIIVLDEGKIVGRGKHEELLRDCDVYKEIALSQLSEAELEGGVS